MHRATVYARTARGRVAAAVDLQLAPLVRRLRARFHREAPARNPEK
jgi:hypothetical protein